MIGDIWRSFRNLPVWVQIWMALFLIPFNLAPLAFLDQPYGILIAVLAITGMALNVPIMVAARGMSNAMALPHLLCWTPMVVVIVMALSGDAEMSSGYVAFLWLLLTVDLISLAFDLNDAVHWFRARKQ